MKREWLSMVTGLALAAAGYACRGYSPSTPTPPAPSVAFLTLKSIVPPAGTILPHGRATHFQATVTYDLGGASFGNVAVATAAASPLIIIPGPVQQLTPPSGSATLAFPLPVPNNAAGVTLQMSFSLFASGSSSSSASFIETYRVAR